MMTDMNTRLHTIASDLNIPLEPVTSSVTVDENGSICIHAMPTNLPKSNDERSLLQSALHAAILDSFGRDVTCLSKLHVQVIVPPVVEDATDLSCPATSWIKSQQNTVNEFAQATAQTMVEGAYTRVLQVYPWRDIENMLVRAVRLVEIFKTNMKLTGAFDPVIANGNVDALLPPIQTLVNNYTAKVILRDVTVFLGRPPTSVLELYESVYSMRKTWCASLETMQLYSLLFKR